MTASGNVQDPHASSWKQLDSAKFLITLVLVSVRRDHNKSKEGKGELKGTRRQKLELGVVESSCQKEEMLKSL